MVKSKETASGFTKEEELLLQDFSRNVSTKSSALFYGNALIVSAVPICKYLNRCVGIFLFQILLNSSLIFLLIRAVLENSFHGLFNFIDFFRNCDWN